MNLGDSLHDLIGFSAFLIPVLLFFLGLHVGEWIADAWPARLSVLTAGLIVLLPIFMSLGPNGSRAGAGWFGESLGVPVVSLFGVAGATILTVTAVSYTHLTLPTILLV